MSGETATSATAETRRVPAGRTGVFVAICSLSFLVNFGRISFAPLVDHFIQAGVSPATAGLAATAVWIGSALPRLPTGYLLTRVRRHRVILGMGVWLAGAAVFAALSPTIWLTIAAALVVGIASGVFFIAANPLISELYPDNVGVAVGLRGMSSQIAAVSAPFLIAVAIGMGSWRLAFWALAGLALAVTAMFGLAARRADLPDAGAGDRELLAGIRAHWRLILAGIAFVGITGFVWQGVFNFYVTYLGARNVPSGTASGLLTLTFAAGVPSFLVAGRLADRFRYVPLLVGIIGAFAACLMAFTVVEGTLAIAAVSVVMGLVIHGLFPVTDAYMLDSLPDATRASAYSGFSATMMLIQATGSVSVGLLAGHGVAYTAVFRGYAVLVAAVAVSMWVLARAGRLPAGG